MNAAAAEEENNAERGTGAPAPALVLVRTRTEPCAAGSPSRAGNTSRHDDVLADQLTGRPGPAGPIGQAMTAMDVRAALARLRPGHRQVIVEMFYLGRSVTGIARLLSIPEGTVTSRGYTWLSEDEEVWGTEPAPVMTTPNAAAAWETVLATVLNIQIPGRSEITGQPWLASQNPGDIYVNYSGVTNVVDVLQTSTNAVGPILDDINTAIQLNADYLNKLKAKLQDFQSTINDMNNPPGSGKTGG